MSVRNKSIDKARGLLKQLFRTENADLDFGIYRIMNFKRAEIERFIDRDLIEAAESVFKKFARAGAAELEKELERRKKEINDFVPGTIGEDWVVLKNHDLPKVKEFLDVLEEYRAASVSEEQVQDVFNHVYEFFSRYYEDGDFIPRTRYGGRDKYYVPYNGEEVLLHWATKDMYYVKTGEYFNKYSFRAGRFKVTFKLMDAQLEQGNLKGDKKFFILHDKDPVQYNEASNEVEIRFNYRILTDEENEKYGRRTRAKRQEDLIDEALTKIRTSLGLGSISGILHARDDDDRSLMRKHLDAYIQRNTKDFFIHKDLKGFLSKELEFYLVNEVLDLDVLENISESQTKLIMAKAKAIRGISTKIVEFLTQIEEFQKRLFEKKKFVRKTDYCITLDLIPESFYEEIGRNKKQITEWKNLYKLDEITKGTFFSTIGINKFSTEFLKEYKNLVLDTKYFNDDFKNILLSNFTNIDSINGGLLVKSENFHAINLLVHKYENKINCVYLDPPYNTGNDEFLYKDNYQSSSWMSMMNDRFVLLNKLLNLSGIVFTSIDDNELSSLDQLLISIYGKNNKVGRIIILSNPRGRFLEKHMATSHEYVLVYSKDILNLKLTDIPLAERQVNEYKFIDDSGKYRLLGLRKRGAYSRKEDRPNLHFPIYYNKKTNEISLMKKNNDFLEIIPKLSGGEDGVWRWSKEKIMKDINYLIVKKIRNRYDVFQKNYLQEDKRIKARTVWTEKEVNYEKGKEILKDMFGYSPYTYPKPVGLIKKIIDMSTKKK